MIDLKKIKLDEEKKCELVANGIVKNKSNFDLKRKFLKGPIYLDWLSKAANLPGKALHVAIYLCYLKGVTKSSEFKLYNKLIEAFGFKRHSKYSGLEALEQAGLIKVTNKHRGRLPYITILDLEEVEKTK